MVASSAALAFRAAASLRARAVSTPHYHRPSMYYGRTAAQVQGFLRYSSDAKPEGAAGEKGKGEGSEAPKEAAPKEAAKEAPKEPPPAPKEVPKKAGRRSRKLLGTSLFVALLVGYVYGTDTRASIHRYGLVPLIRLLYPDAEDAHHMGVDTLKQLYKFGLHPRERGNPDDDGALATEVGKDTAQVYLGLHVLS